MTYNDVACGDVACDMACDVSGAKDMASDVAGMADVAFVAGVDVVGFKRGHSKVMWPCYWKQKQLTSGDMGGVSIG